jgi:multidrug resistance efflux pump
MAQVDCITREINVANTQPNDQGVATVNPIFTWVRLAQRTPVRIHIDQVPAGIVLVVRMTAAIKIDELRDHQKNRSGQACEHCFRLNAKDRCVRRYADRM